MLWPTNTTFPNGKLYNYDVGSPTGLNRDLVREFFDACRAHNIRPGLYYSLSRNFYLNEFHFRVLNTSLLPKQVLLSQGDFEALLLDQLKELWTTYSPIAEVWFDGGVSESLAPRVAALLKPLNATAMNGFGISDHPTKWVGTESGLPVGPIWSTGSEKQGDPMGADFVPTTCDTTIAHKWFYTPDMKVRSLEDLINIYHRTVGNNCVLELGFAALPSGEIPTDQMQRAKELGDWIRSCYSRPAFETHNLEMNLEQAVVIDRMVLMEDLRFGQRILEYLIQVTTDMGEEVEFGRGFSVGHKAIVIGKPVKLVNARLSILRSRGNVHVKWRIYRPCIKLQADELQAVEL